MVERVFILQTLCRSNKTAGTAKKISHVMDRWIASRATRLIQEVTAYMDAYDVVNASRVLMAFVDELSTWYLRESRDRLRDKTTNGEASQVFGWVLLTLAKLFSPITPFFPELLYQHLEQVKGESIHLEDWPVADDQYLNDELEKEMGIIRQSAIEIHAERKAKQIKVRQPLSFASLATTSVVPNSELQKILSIETNIDRFEWKVLQNTQKLLLNLNTDITIGDLRARGEMREVMRVIQDLRKEANVAFDAYVNVQLPSWPKQFEDMIFCNLEYFLG